MKFSVRSPPDASLMCCGHFTINRRLPALQRPLVDWRVVCKRGIRNFCDQFSVLQNPHHWIARHAANFRGIEPPLFENLEHFRFAALFGDEQHALLGFRKHDFVSGHPGFALWYAIEFDFKADSTARAHFTRGTCQAGCSHVLDTHNRTSLHGFKAGFEQQFLHERIPDLHVRALRFRSFAEFLARHGGAMDAIAPSL